MKETGGANGIVSTAAGGVGGGGAERSHPLFELGYKKAVVEVGKKPQEEGGASADEWEAQSDSSGERELHVSE